MSLHGLLTPACPSYSKPVPQPRESSSLWSVQPQTEEPKLNTQNYSS